jgi:TonB family protein
MHRCQTFSDALVPHAVPADRIAAAKWRRYVSCTLGSYMIVDLYNVPENPEGIVSIRLNPDGSIASISELHSSGNPAWDAAVQRAIAVASPLPAAPVNRPFTRVDMHFRPKPGVAAGNAGISDTSHWSAKHCTLSGSLTTCG